MDSTARKIDSLSEALHLLDEAAEDRRDELGQLISTHKYSHLRKLMGTSPDELKKSFEEARENVVHLAHRVQEETKEAVKQTARSIDKEVHNHPWPFLGGVAASTLLLGFLLGKRL